MCGFLAGDFVDFCHRFLVSRKLAPGFRPFGFGPSNGSNLSDRLFVSVYDSPGAPLKLVFILGVTKSKVVKFGPFGAFGFEGAGKWGVNS